MTSEDVSVGEKTNKKEQGQGKPTQRARGSYQPRGEEKPRSKRPGGEGGLREYTRVLTSAGNKPIRRSI